MSFIAIKRGVIAALIAIASTQAYASEARAPHYLTEPVLGLRLAPTITLDPLPDELRSRCSRLADDDESSVHLWLFAQASDAGARYFVASGYLKMRHPLPGTPSSVPIVRGGLFVVTGTTCVDDPADDAFAARDLTQTPLPILQQLADDLAKRLVRAVGGADRLRTEIRNQRIDFDALSPELQKAFKPYFDASK